ATRAPRAATPPPRRRCRPPAPTRVTVETNAGDEWHRREAEAAMMEPIEASERGRLIDFAGGALRNIWPVAVSLRLDTRELDHLGPLLGFVGDELAEVAW